MKARMATRYNAQVEKSVEKRKPVSLYFRFSRGGYLIDIIIKDIYKYEKRVKRRDFQAPSGGGFVVWVESNTSIETLRFTLSSYSSIKSIV